MDIRLAKALEYIRDHLEDPICMNQLADVACTSYRNLLRLFRQSMDTTPFRYIEKVKVRKSLQWIWREDFSVRDISDALGYKNYETFSKAFAKTYHIPPGDLKEIVRSQLPEHKNDSPMVVLDILTAGSQDHSELLSEWYAGQKNKQESQAVMAFIASRKPLSKGKPEIKILNKYYVSKISSLDECRADCTL